MRKFTLHQTCALITGASSGLGMEFARQLAPHAHLLILVARRRDVLEEFKEELLLHHPALRVYVQECDLSKITARENLALWVQQEALPINLLINNAGLGDLGSFATAEWNRIEQILEVNVTALTHLTQLFLPTLRASQPSALLQVGSIAGFLPLPYHAVYAASKAYVASFTKALSIEEESHGVFVSLLSPGPVPTPFFETASRSGEENKATSRVPQPLITSATDVVTAALNGLLNQRFSVIPNQNLRIATKLCSMLPRQIFKKLFLLNKNFHEEC